MTTSKVGLLISIINIFTSL